MNFPKGQGALLRYVTLYNSQRCLVEVCTPRVLFLVTLMMGVEASATIPHPSCLLRRVVGHAGSYPGRSRKRHISICGQFKSPVNLICMFLDCTPRIPRQKPHAVRAEIPRNPLNSPAVRQPCGHPDHRGARDSSSNAAAMLRTRNVGVWRREAHTHAVTTCQESPQP